MSYPKPQIIALFIVGFLILVVSSYAQIPPMPPDHDEEFFNGRKENPEKQEELRTKRQAELHDKLKLSSAQELAWIAYIQTTKHEDFHARPAKQNSDLSAPEREDQKLAFLKNREMELEKESLSLSRLYGMFSTEQRRIFDQQFSAIDDLPPGDGPPPRNGHR